MNPVTVLIVAVVCVAVGFLVGILINTLKGDRETPAAPVQTVAQPPAAVTTQVEIARFFRDRPGEPILVEMEGKTYGNSLELDTPQREILEDLVIEVRNFLGQLSVFSNTEPESTGYGGGLYREQKPAFSTSAYASGPSPFTLDQPALAAAPVQAKSIVGQIDDILQDKLSGTKYANEGIRLSESPTKGAVVMIGRTAYPGIDEIPDEEVKEMIRQSVTEWETRAK